MKASIYVTINNFTKNTTLPALTTGFILYFSTPFLMIVEHIVRAISAVVANRHHQTDLPYINFFALAFDKIASSFRIILL
jgi:hypothetical protein